MGTNNPLPVHQRCVDSLSFGLVYMGIWDHVPFYSIVRRRVVQLLLDAIHIKLCALGLMLLTRFPKG